MLRRLVGVLLLLAMLLLLMVVVLLLVLVLLVLGRGFALHQMIPLRQAHQFPLLLLELRLLLLQGFLLGLQLRLKLLLLLLRLKLLLLLRLKLLLLLRLKLSRVVLGLWGPGCGVLLPPPQEGILIVALMLPALCPRRRLLSRLGLSPTVPPILSLLPLAALLLP